MLEPIGALHDKIHHSRSACSDVISETSATDISRLSDKINNSKSSVNPLTGQAHGASTCLTPHCPAANPRHASMKIGFVLEEVEVAPSPV